MTKPEKTAKESPTAGSGGPPAPPGGGAGAKADRVVEEGDSASVSSLVAQLLSDSRTGSTNAARVLGEIATKKPTLLASHVEKLIRALESENKRVVQTAADALPAVAQVVPARVAKHLDKLKTSFPGLSEMGQDGVVRTFATLCAASVAYQKRLEPVLKLALGKADEKMLVAWTATVLPALKGEPHANARAVVESRIPELKRPQAQAIADFLGIKLRRR